VKLKVVYIIWNDASSGSTPEEIDTKDCLQESVGFLYKKDKYNYIVARDYNHLNSQFEECLRIPKKYVVEYKEL
jgi:hypothetical protein